MLPFIMERTMKHFGFFKKYDHERMNVDYKFINNLTLLATQITDIFRNDFLSNWKSVNIIQWMFGLKLKRKTLDSWFDSLIYFNFIDSLS